MSTIVIVTAGTLGDHLPYLELGKQLQGRGHRVIMAINESMHPYALKAGLDFVTCGTKMGESEAQKGAEDWDELHPSSKTLVDKLAQMKAFFEHDLPLSFQQLLSVCESADLLIYSIQRQTQALMVQQRLGIPAIPVSVMPAFNCAESGFRVGNKSQLMPYLSPTIDKIVADLGFQQLDYSPQQKLGILASSPHFAKVNQENSFYQATGFWFYQDAEWKNWQPEPRIREFMERSPSPLVLSFSSLPLIDAPSVLELHVQAAAKLGRSLLVHRGWANFNESMLSEQGDRHNVMFVDFIPQDWLFSQAGAVIHHGGIGTIARALKNDCPMLIEPYGNDQFFNAKRVVALKVGAAVHSKKITPDGLAKILETKVLTNECKGNTQILGAKIRQETGLETACDLINKILEPRF